VPLPSTLAEDDSQRRGDFELARLRDVREDVAIEVNLAALPTRALHDRRYCRLEPFVRVTDDELRPCQAAFAKRTQECRPAFLTFRVDDVDRDHVPEAASRYAVRDDDRIADHGVVDSDLS